MFGQKQLPELLFKVLGVFIVLLCGLLFEIVDLEVEIEDFGFVENVKTVFHFLIDAAWLSESAEELSPVHQIGVPCLFELELIDEVIDEQYHDFVFDAGECGLVD